MEKEQDKNKPRIVPEQHTGAKTGASETVDCGSMEEARQVFNDAKQRMLDINNWQNLAGKAGATFKLTDAMGNEVGRAPQKGDHIKIDLPGPGPTAGKGDDWVQIEEIEDKTDAMSNSESFGIRVRPAADPRTPGDETAHFYTEDATSTFMVMREGKTVTASEHGRNEVPNAGAESIIDKARNVAVAVGAMAVASHIQWKAFVRGLLGK